MYTHKISAVALFLTMIECLAFQIAKNKYLQTRFHKCILQLSGSHYA